MRRTHSAALLAAASITQLRNGGLQAMIFVKTRTARDERRRGVRALIASPVVLAATLALWWLVATTNREGHHDAQLLPILTVIPLCIALWHFAWVWYLDRHETPSDSGDHREHERHAA